LIKKKNSLFFFFFLFLPVYQPQKWKRFLLYMVENRKKGGFW
jgi:hypothetical protein